jgi:succinate dehydrogenase / fumarate reductase membrane anchor subunit
MKGPLTGLRAWLVQRVSALYLLGFILFLTTRVASSQWTYASWREFVLAPWMRVGLLLFFVALLVHVWVGLRDVILDYVHPAALRTAMLAGVAAGEIAVAAWAANLLVPG